MRSTYDRSIVGFPIETVQHALNFLMKVIDNASHEVKDTYSFTHNIVTYKWSQACHKAFFMKWRIYHPRLQTLYTYIIYPY